jgi:hypothetical protein
VEVPEEKELSPLPKEVSPQPSEVHISEERVPTPKMADFSMPSFEMPKLVFEMPQ